MSRRGTARGPSATRWIAALLALVAACGGGDVARDGGTSPDAGAVARDGGAAADGGAVSHDGGAAADGGADGGARAGSGAECTFNSDCPAAERCECDEATGCFCFEGARGTGRAGYETCVDGNDCASSVCAEGPGGTFYCSGPCTRDADCGPNLPTCADIAFIGKICIR